MRAAIYARVSTENQSVAMQMAELQTYAKNRGWSWMEYQDTASGAREKRPSLDALMATARRRGFDCVVVWKFDRFARSVSHLVRALEEFKALGIGFVSLTEAIDTTTPAGELVFTVMAAIAQFERELTRERVKAGIEHARRQGRKLGRPRVVTMELSDQVRTLRAEGKSWNQIERLLKTPGPTLRRAVRPMPKSPLQSLA